MSARPRVTAAVLAGGTGTRMGAPRPKQLLPLDGRPVIEHSVSAFCAAPEVDDVIVLMVPDGVAEVDELVAERGLHKVRAVLPGGATRTQTSRAALEALSSGSDDDLVLLHDAARPLVRPPTIAACVAALGTAGAVGVAIPSSDTVVEVRTPRPGSEVIASVPPRASLRRMQTPQGFRLGVLRRAHELALADPDPNATDDCGLVLRFVPDEEVRIVRGEESNLKVTNPGDIEIAEVLLRRIREREGRV